MRVNVTEQGLIIPKEFLAGIQSVEIRRDHDQIILTPTVEHQSSNVDPISYAPKTPLGKRLRELRAKIVASGEPLLTAEDIDREIDEQRNRFKEFET
jgi:virulence-associated protein VagC